MIFQQRLNCICRAPRYCLVHGAAISFGVLDKSKYLSPGLLSDLGSVLKKFDLDQGPPTPYCPHAKSLSFSLAPACHVRSVPLKWRNGVKGVTITNSTAAQRRHSLPEKAKHTPPQLPRQASLS